MFSAFEINNVSDLTGLPHLQFKKGIHYPSLDGLRGIAVILVFIFHTMSYVQIFRLGWIGVDLFFVLSGFLITGILFDSKNEVNYYKNFIVRRALRIFPLYFFFIFLIIWILPDLFPTVFTGMSYYQQHQSWYWFYISNWLPFSTTATSSTLLDHLWSLSIEEQFYICWPFIVLFFQGRVLIKICLFLILCAIVVRYEGAPLLGYVKIFEYYNTFARIDSLLIGALISLLYRLRPVILVRSALPILFISAAIIVVIIIHQKKLDFANLIDTFTLWDLFFGSVLIFSISQKNNWLKSLLGTRLFKFFGKYSYGLYVYHQPVNKLMFDKFIGPMHLSFPFLPIIATIVCLSLSIGMALLSYNLIEKPFLRLKKYFEPIQDLQVR